MKLEIDSRRSGSYGSMVELWLECAVGKFCENGYAILRANDFRVVEGWVMSVCHRIPREQLNHILYSFMTLFCSVKVGVGVARRETGQQLCRLSQHKMTKKKIFKKWQWETFYSNRFAGHGCSEA